MTKPGMLSGDVRISRRLLEQYRAERTTLQRLAEIYDVSVSTVWRTLKRQGVCRDSRRGRPRNTEKHPLVIDLATQGLSRRQIAAHVGVTPEWVRCILAHHGMAVSLRILKCRDCGAPVASGHKALSGDRVPHVFCAACVRQHPNVSFAERLKALRLADNLSRAELSARCGLSRAVIGNYERGEGLPTPNSAHKLAEALGLSVSELTGGGNSQPPELTHLPASCRPSA
jgi:DNA-binding XRE family transcriptional regulator